MIGTYIDLGSMTSLMSAGSTTVSTSSTISKNAFLPRSTRLSFINILKFFLRHYLRKSLLLVGLL